MTMSINGTNGLTFNDASTQNTAATGFGFKNRLINGGMTIDQRNSGASVTPTISGQYTIDRWSAYITQTGKLTFQQGTNATPVNGFSNYLGISSLSAYSVLSTDGFALQQKIEGLNVADFSFGNAQAKTVTLSFQVNSSLTGTFGGSIYNSAANRFYPFSYSIPVANTATSIAIVIPGDTTGTWGVGNGLGLTVSFGLGAGSTLSAAAGAWTTSPAITCTGATSIVGTSGATFYITGVQLEKGSTATAFDVRPVGTELALCLRYYQRITGAQYYGYQSNAGSGYRNVAVIWPVQLRTGTPTTTVDASTGGTLAVASSNQFGANFNVNLGNTTGDVYLTAYSTYAEL